MPLNQGNLAQNVRRLAGMHLASIEKLADYIGVSRPTLQAIVAHDPAQRSLPKVETAAKLAEAFAVSLNTLYQEPEICLREAAENFGQAPIAKAVKVPSVTLGDVQRAASKEGVPVVVQMPRKKKGQGK
jgi:DNA-binding XRE family transcriptional regulator